MNETYLDKDNPGRQITSNGATENPDLHKRLANSLGWFSIGLGLAELIAPGGLAKAVGLKNEDRTRWTLRMYGLREITSGVGILSQSNPAGWLWGRVGGDLLDLATLAGATGSQVTDASRMGVAQAAVLGVTALDVYCASQLSRTSSTPEGEEKRGELVKKSMLINRSPEEVYRFWRSFENLPRFMSHLESVEVTDERQSHWTARLPGGLHVDWNAEIVEDQPNSYISWRSVEGSDIQTTGSVRFEPGPGNRGTVVRVEMRYSPPGGKLTAKIASILGADPAGLIEQDLRALKQILEVGEIVRSDSSIHRRLHPARPAADDSHMHLLEEGTR